MWIADSLEKTLMLGKTEGLRRRGWERRRCLDSINNSMAMDLSKLRRQWRTEKPGVLHSMGSQKVRHNWVTEQQQQYFGSIQTTTVSKAVILELFSLLYYLLTNRRRDKRSNSVYWFLGNPYRWWNKSYLCSLWYSEGLPTSQGRLLLQ